MDWIASLIDILLHLDRHLNIWAGTLGPWLYVVLFLVLFCETGLVVTPFLPGDSLLFAVGALASIDGSPLSLPLLLLVLVSAAVLGDAANYAIGHYVGPKVFSSPRSRLLNPKHVQRTHEFYARHGGKTIFLARFVPIVRTFAPFIAGIGEMSYRPLRDVERDRRHRLGVRPDARRLLLRPHADRAAELRDGHPGDHLHLDPAARDRVAARAPRLAGLRRLGAAA